MVDILLGATIYLGTAIISVPFSKRLGMGSVLGYILAGVVVGQLYGLLNRPQVHFEHITEFGVIFLLFVIGLDLDPKSLWQMRNKLVGLGGLQLGVTTAVIALGAYALGFNIGTGLAIGMTLALSSTAMVLQTLSEKNLLSTEGGRSSLSVLLTQDMAFVPMLILIPLVAFSGSGGDANSAGAADQGHGETGAALQDMFLGGLPPWGQFGVTLGSIAAIVLIGYFLVRPMYRYITASGLVDISIAATLFVVCLAGLLTSMVGLSPALGTFIAGVMLANSEFRHEMEGNIEPFKALFLGLFFVTVGASIDFVILFDEMFLVLAITIALILSKAAVLLLLSHLFSVAGRDRLLFTLGLAQAGEFSFVLLAFMNQTDIIGSRVGDVLTLVVTMSMVFTPALFVLYEYFARQSPVVESIEGDSAVVQEPVIIAGVGRFGQMVNDMCVANGIPTTVMDSDIRVINMMRKLGIRAFLGDITRPETLQAAGLASARVLVVALDDPETIDRLVRYARTVRPDLYIIARARDREHVFSLYQARADEIVRETFDSSLRAGRYVLQRLGYPEDEARFRESSFFHSNRRITQELAAVWDPDLPAEKNTVYLQRLRELNRSMGSSTGFASRDRQMQAEEDRFVSDGAKIAKKYILAAAKLLKRNRIWQFKSGRSDSGDGSARD
ncbi:MAG: cation:proton antiporter [Rhodobacteraceae bacterium]|nr:cation:proton antiporter [Paracoccaceae bacterium]